MNVKFDNKDSEQLNNEGYITLEGKGAPPLMIITMEYLQKLANIFSSGLSVEIAGVMIEGQGGVECPECVKEKN